MAMPWDYSKEENQPIPSINPTGAPLIPMQVSTQEQLKTGQYESHTTKNESVNCSHDTQSMDTYEKG